MCQAVEHAVMQCNVVMGKSVLWCVVGRQILGAMPHFDITSDVYSTILTQLTNHFQLFYFRL